ncbi:hypothetical protein F5888DRAFT_1702817 [Russula emetica]|nr:hypothetical protein F5888DRAFT_1702817 [Russula emetica]
MRVVPMSVMALALIPLGSRARVGGTLVSTRMWLSTHRRPLGNTDYFFPQPGALTTGRSYAPPSVPRLFTFFLYF